MPRREVLLLAEMIDAAEQAQHPATGRDAEAIEADRQRRDALLWNSPSPDAAGPRRLLSCLEVRWLRLARLRVTGRCLRGFYMKARLASSSVS